MRTILQGFLLTLTMLACKEAVEKKSNKIHEAADVFYHLIMYLESNDIEIEKVMSELKNRKK